MKKSSAELKRTAREALMGKYPVVVFATLATTLIPSVLLYPFASRAGEGSASQNLIYFFASIIITLIEIILTCGLIRLHLNIAKNRPYLFSDILFGFQNRPQKIVGAYFYLLLLLLPAILPGCILLSISLILIPDSAPFMGIAIIALIIGIIFEIKIALQYGLIYYLLMENPDASVREIFRESKSLMDGNKLRLLYLNLSFLGLILLASLSLGIGMLWIGPYMAQTTAHFYLDVLDEKVTVVDNEYL